MMCDVAAAPHLFDDVLNASPELALVDLDLATKLRADIRAGEEFRPREAARPAFRLLLPDVESVDVILEPPSVEGGENVHVEAVAAEEIVLDVDPVVVALEPSELPDYVVAPEEPNYPTYPSFLGGTLEEVVVDEGPDLPDYVVVADPVETGPIVTVPVEEASPASDYPQLPDLGEASEALEETDAALRKIREHLGSDESDQRRRLRRGFTVLSGLGAVGAVAVFAVDLRLGVVALPGWLGF
jgi:hypothetical protein